MRKLNKDELKITKQSIERTEKRNKRLRYIIKADTLEVNEGCFFRYELELEKYKKDLKIAQKELEDNIKTLENLNKQIKEGVQEKIREITG